MSSSYKSYINGVRRSHAWVDNQCHLAMTQLSKADLRAILADAASNTATLQSRGDSLPSRRSTGGGTGRISSTRFPK
jgi:hypothetical protein